MSAVSDLTFLGAPIGDPRATAAFIGRMVITRRQKAALLTAFLSERRVALSADVRAASADFQEFL